QPLGGRLGAGVVEAHPVAQRPLLGVTPQAGAVVARLGVGGDGPDLDVPEAEHVHPEHGGGVLVHPGREAEHARDVTAERGAHRGGGPSAQRRPHDVGQHRCGGDAPDRPERELVRPFGVDPDQEAPEQQTVEPHARGHAIVSPRLTWGLGARRNRGWKRRLKAYMPVKRGICSSSNRALSLRLTAMVNPIAKAREIAKATYITIIPMIATSGIIEAKKSRTIEAIASGRKYSLGLKWASTWLRTQRRTGPLSRGGRYRSSPVRIASCCLAYSSLRRRRASCRAALRSAGTSGRLRCASTSLRFGVGRPLPCGLGFASGSGAGAGVSFLLRPITPRG